MARLSCGPFSREPFPQRTTQPQMQTKRMPRTKQFCLDWSDCYGARKGSPHCSRCCDRLAFNGLCRQRCLRSPKLTDWSIN
jgi:hypothetical protein